jgi:SAM-dependent methyltransferase
VYRERRLKGAGTRSGAPRTGVARHAVTPYTTSYSAAGVPVSEDLPRLYGALADWFHLLTAPADYVDEAALYTRLLREASSALPRTLLELGSGGGCMAFHYKRQFASTLVDLSPGMLAASEAINPECEHHQGDMRTVRLGRLFDLVLVHDAVMHMTSEADLARAMATAFAHLRPGGAALFAPDCVRETFVPHTDHGGYDGAGRGLRYLEWTTDPDPADTTYVVDYVYLLREGNEPPRVEHDHLIEGLFSRADWVRLLERTGFRAAVHTFTPEESPNTAGDLFVGVKPAG